MVISNTTPFTALSSIQRLECLHDLFGTIHVATSVVNECLEGGRILVPDLRKIEWITIVPNPDNANLPLLFELDRGEKHTIAIALKS